MLADEEGEFEYVESGQFKKRPRDFGCVVHGAGNTSLVSIHTNATNGSIILYTMASDYMLRGWNLKKDGKCFESRILTGAQPISSKCATSDTLIALARAHISS